MTSSRITYAIVACAFVCGASPFDGGLVVLPVVGAVFYTFTESAPIAAVHRDMAPTPRARRGPNRHYDAEPDHTVAQGRATTHEQGVNVAPGGRAVYMRRAKHTAGWYR